MGSQSDDESKATLPSNLCVSFREARLWTVSRGAEAMASQELGEKPHPSPEERRCTRE